jgi:MFS family permease
LIGRSIEGIGFAIMMVTAPTVISMWFKPDKRGLPMGIWATWVPVGLFIIYNLAKTIEIAFTWRGVWWFNAIFALIVLIIYYKIVDFPLKEWEYNKKSEKTQKIKISQGIKNTNTLRLTIIFMVIGMSMQGYSTWLPTYLKNTGLNATDANFSASLITMGMIPAIVLAGLILNHTKNHKYILTTGLSLTAIILILWFSFGNNFSVIPWMIAIGLSSGLTPTCIFTMASETVIRPEFAGIALAMVNMGYNFGAIIGPPIVGTIINKLGWNPVKYFVVIPITITIILAISIIEKKK